VNESLQGQDGTVTSRPVLIGALVLAVMLIVSAVHWPVLSAQALAFDDGEFIVHNALVQNPGWKSAKRFLSEVFEPSTVHGYYIPLTMISLMLDNAAGGRSDDLRQFHRTNLTLHLMSTAGLVLLLYLLFRQPWVAAMLGLIYGIHPLTVEPIAWIGERKTVLATCFALWCIVLYVLGTRNKSRRLLVGSVVLFVLAVMSKPTTVPLPILLLILDYWPLNRLDRRRILEKVPYFAVAGISAVITVVSNARTANITMPTDASVAPVLLKITHSLFFYLRKMLWPTDLTSYYPSPDPFTLDHPMVLTGVVVTGVVALAVVISVRWTRCILAGSLFFLAAILPTLGIVGFSWISVSDKYLYLPAVGLLLPAAYLLRRVWDQPLSVGGIAPQRRGIILAVLFLATLATVGTRRYLRQWQDSQSLYTYMLSLAPDAGVLHYSLGNTMADQGRFNEASVYYRRAAQLDPDMPDIYVGLGMALAKLGRTEEAFGKHTRALQINPNSAAAHNGLGTVLNRRGELDRAAMHYAEAIRIKPDFQEALINLGALRLRQGRLDDAAEQFRTVLQINPRSVEAHVNLGVTLRRQGKLDAAIPHYKAALRRQPLHPEIHRNIGLALQEQGKADEAKMYFANALFYQGLALHGQGKLDAAEARYEEALRLNPQHDEASRSLSALAAEQGGR
jgi:tetratricopeptide (TPR) repeat protein